MIRNVFKRVLQRQTSWPAPAHFRDAELIYAVMREVPDLLGARIAWAIDEPGYGVVTITCPRNHGATLILIDMVKQALDRVKPAGIVLDVIAEYAAP